MKNYNHRAHNLLQACGFRSDEYNSLMMNAFDEFSRRPVISRFIEEIEQTVRHNDSLLRLLCLQLVVDFLKERRTYQEYSDSLKDRHDGRYEEIPAARNSA